MEIQEKFAIAGITMILKGQLTTEEQIALFMAASMGGNLNQVMGFDKLQRLNGNPNGPIFQNLLVGDKLKPFAAKAIELLAMDAISQ